MRRSVRSWSACTRSSTASEAPSSAKAMSGHWSSSWKVTTFYAPAVSGIKRYRDPSVCLSQPGCGHADLAACSWPDAGDVRTRPRTDVDPPRVEMPSGGRVYCLAAPGPTTCSKMFPNDFTTFLLTSAIIFGK